MRTAEEYIKEKFPNADQLDWFKPICECLNSARRELLEEASKRATVTSSCSVWNCEGESVDKQSILNLINELK